MIFGGGQRDFALCYEGICYTDDKDIMARPKDTDGKRNLIAQRLIELRKERHLSQRGLANELQLVGIDMDKNVITRIETGKRYVTDIELRAICKVFNVTYDYLIDGK